MNDQLTMFVGTYTDLGAEGIYTCRLDIATGAIECLTSNRASKTRRF